MGGESFALGRRIYRAEGPTLLMGILNVTPDSFYDGGRYADAERALQRGLELVAAGAAVLDVGGESTRPGAAPVDVATELERTVPVIRALASRVPAALSIDSSKPEVVEAALQAGASVVNDVRGLRDGDDLARLAAAHEASLVLMHSRARPADMQQHTDYEDLLGEVVEELAGAAARARAAGVPRQRILLDPGIGFAKDAAGSLALLRQLDRVLALGYAVLVGPSRKSFIGAVTGQAPEERLMGTAAACVAAALKGARVLRVHDVAELKPALQVADALRLGLAG